MIKIGFLITLLIGIIAGIFLTIIYEIINKHLFKEPKLKIKGFHIHHSVAGLFFLTIYFMYFSTLSLGLSLGIIIRHSYEDKFTFIERIKDKFKP